MVIESYFRGKPVLKKKIRTDKCIEMTLKVKYFTFNCRWEMLTTPFIIIPTTCLTKSHHKH